MYDDDSHQFLMIATQNMSINYRLVMMQCLCQWLWTFHGILYHYIEQNLFVHIECQLFQIIIDNLLSILIDSF